MNHAVWRLPRIVFGLRNIWLNALRNWRWFLFVEESLWIPHGSEGYLTIDMFSTNTYSRSWKQIRRAR
jgi:hypothetical protein